MREEARKQLVARAIQAAPLEACGFILEGDEIFEVTNVSLAPAKAFRMDRSELVEHLVLTGKDQFITGIWHTHPRGSQHPSPTDLDGIKLGAIQRNWDYFIVTAAGVYQYETKLFVPHEHEEWAKFLKV